MVQIRNEKGQFINGNKNENIVGRDNKGRFISKLIQTIVPPVEQPQQNTESDKKMFEPKKDSRATAIENALVQGASTVEEIADMVIIARPNDDVKKVRNQVKAILRDIREKKGRWTKYNIAEEGVKIVLK